MFLARRCRYYRAPLSPSPPSSPPSCRLQKLLDEVDDKRRYIKGAHHHYYHYSTIKFKELPQNLGDNLISRYHGRRIFFLEGVWKRPTEIQQYAHGSCLLEDLECIVFRGLLCTCARQRSRKPAYAGPPPIHVIAEKRTFSSAFDGGSGAEECVSRAVVAFGGF